MRAMTYIAAKKGDYDAAVTWSRRLVDDVTPTAADYNRAAWVALFRGKELERAIEDARHATGESEKRGHASSLHTLAALYAEVGKTVEARQALLKAMDSRTSDEPTSDDWFVLGRIAETYGVRDAAIAAYKRVEKEEPNGVTTWELAQRRMTALGMK
jgi:tetratricopeptide (TPR) repeat protein